MRLLLLMLPLLPVLGACAPAVMVGAGAVTAGAIAEEREVDDVVADNALTLRINRELLENDPEIFREVGTTITEGRVLLTGQVETPEQRVEAVRLTWAVPGVREVINEIEVAQSDGFPGYARDTWISTQLRSRITFDRSIASLNYSIETVGGVVYLMGIASSDAERQRVAAHARQISYVRRIVDHTRLKTEA